ncbi:hypothetical protein VNO77_25469 [Canavalia gladiata]|uniref:Peptidase metallopeptidase domain-containing protein n=1 Tax=Canavalia gladiata TaxID=3824 RepID=A0AAN9QDL3_CANGL
MEVALKTLLRIFLLFLVAQPLRVHSRSLRSTNKRIQNGTETSEGVIEFAKARKYLKAFGYVEENGADFNTTNTGDLKVNNDDVFDEDLERSIKRFQEFYHLNVSGKLDSETIKLMSKPRCGVPDFGLKVSSKFAFIEGKPKWSKKNLTYRFESGMEIIPIEVLRSVFEEAFTQWSNVSSFTFEEAPNGTDADIEIGFFSGDHGDGFPFNRFGPILAHTFPPPDGRLHVNEDKPWSDTIPIKGRYYDLVWVAMHEIGHLLGLDHSSHHHAIMYAYVDIGVNRRTLDGDDIASIQSLYSSPSMGYGENSRAVRSSPAMITIKASKVKECWFFFHLEDECDQDENWASIKWIYTQQFSTIYSTIYRHKRTQKLIKIRLIVVQKHIT